MSPELVALAVHDLKNELGGLETELAELERDPSPAGLRRARATCEQLRREMVAFLTLYRGDALQALVDDESPRELLASMCGSDPGGLVVELGPGERAPPFWYFDPRLVRLALDAALHNARRYARQRIVLDAEQRGDCLVLSIDDDGPGLAAGAGAHDAWSTGLGTELCRAVARAHRLEGRHGEVRLFDRPDRLQGGARFELILP